MYSAKEITNYYLYGALNKPSDLNSEKWIGREAPEPLSVDAVKYMKDGPGRFASAERFEVVNRFFDPFDIMSSFLKPGEYDKKALFEKFHMDFGGMTLQQWAYDDGKDDLTERAYIWNTTAFKLGDDVKFIIAEDGTRTIEKFSIVPYSNPDNPENFDFTAGDGIGAVANYFLEPAIDPSGIGHKFDFDFENVGKIGTKTYTYEDWKFDKDHPLTANPANLGKIVSNFPSFVQKLWDGGSTNTVDENGRVILYGTDASDDLSLEKIENLSSYDPLKKYFLSSNDGITLIGGKKADKLMGTDSNDELKGGAGDDILYGGKGSDILRGGVGHDFYILASGEGNHTIIDSDRTGTIIIDGMIIIDAVRPYEHRPNHDVDYGPMPPSNGSTYRAGGWDENGNFSWAHRLVWQDRDLILNETYRIKDFKNGDFHIWLTIDDWGHDWNIDGTPPRSAFEPQPVDPHPSDPQPPEPGASDESPYPIANVMPGGEGTDYYSLSRGDGHNKIMEFGINGDDTLYFGEGISIDDIVVSRNDLDLTLSIAHSEDSVTIGNWFRGNDYRIEYIEFANGTKWDAADIDSLVGTLPITGTSGSDSLYGNSGANIFVGGAGNDELDGGEGSDTYLFNLGDGKDTIFELGTSEVDVVRFGPGIDADDIVVSRSGDNLVLSIAGTEDSITVRDWLWADYCRIERFEFANGAVWDAPAISAIVAALLISGTSGSDSLYGDSGANIFVGGTGDDELDGGQGSDTYLFNRGDSKDTIFELGTAEVDVVRFGPDINAEDIVVSRSGDNLVPSIAGTEDSITVRDWHWADYYRIERFEFANGNVWEGTELELIGVAYQELLHG